MLYGCKDCIVGSILCSSSGANRIPLHVCLVMYMYMAIKLSSSSSSLTVYNVEMFLGFRSLPIRRPTLLIIRSIVGGHDRSYDRSIESILIARPRVRPIEGRKTDRSMRSLLAIVTNIADRSHVRQIATDRTIKQSYDPI